jgi:Fe-S-cluster-containing hydrogenase component 2
MVFETKACTGCRSCELSCSYHHSGTFRPAISSVRVSERINELSYSLTIFESERNGHRACDLCRGLAEPLCVKYCNPLMREELQLILRKFRDATEK